MTYPNDNASSDSTQEKSNETEKQKSHRTVAPPPQLVCSVSTTSREVPGQDNVQNYLKTQAHMTHTAQGAAPSSFNMQDMRSALPGYQSHSIIYEQHHIQQPFVHTAHPHGVIYAMPPLPSFHGATIGANMTYNTHFNQVYPSYLQRQHENLLLPHGATGYQSLVPHSPSHLNVHIPGQASGYGPNYYSQTAYTGTLGHGPGPPTTSSSAQVQSRVDFQNMQGPPIKIASRLGKETSQRRLDMEYDVSKTIVDGSTPMRPIPIQTSPADSTSHSPVSSAPRGSPRKPKQSGHALWVGNLPPGTNVVDLKDYFSQGATKELESVFLISKSNCAFINYRTETACSAALSRFNDSRFHGARLVCRLRQGTVSPGSNPDSIGSPTPTLCHDGDAKLSNTEVERAGAESRPSRTRVPSRYFIVKSLTVDDLELSRQSNIWATQTHNEEQLNQAYENADDVYLIFSANKSGEYYGYARMMSPIQDDETLTLEMPPRLDNPDPEALDVTPTPATSTAPDGRIINDSARGTIFWEAASSEDESGMGKEKATPERVEEPTNIGTQLIGKPFRIRWLSATRVPFHRTRGLRNPWNSNREVKIARDGTEIEPEVGWKLLQLFHSQFQQ
ncbi:hypothetical protein BO94DRAFT_472989 [Aspergillus sclerotioniger CBS 115572]|uniref:YT521-B-like splicing factor n=1 Tax=Aspergillus sclerotioniger CBS 115572 TaxID=1450535 RepID=A0A317VU94_9EURO|nr:hypothetical protein BO94DRAFT_472989 [Aspergillus sclerotioniger CBS 115572]PWY77159.1 hypothetical protein BO94DRAFT_472989 [Aspergillus sclerotioniger CBS 115572]